MSNKTIITKDNYTSIKKGDIIEVVGKCTTFYRIVTVENCENSRTGYVLAIKTNNPHIQIGGCFSYSFFDSVGIWIEGVVNTIDKKPPTFYLLADPKAFKVLYGE